MLMGALISLLVSMGLVILRAILGPTAFDRVLAVNSFGTLVVLLIVLLGTWMNTTFFVDIALIYALINFVTTVAFLRYIERQKVKEAS